MSEKDRLKWDARYGTSGYIYGSDPAPFIVEQRAGLPEGGRALDVAAGEGQNAVYLAGEGFSVEALDISAVGLRKARALAEEKNVVIQPRLWDLERSFVPEGPYDVIICMHYKQQTLAEPIADALAPGGVVLIELATVNNLELHKHPSRPYCVESNELMGWFPTLQLRSYREGIFNNQAVARVVAQKPAAKE